MKPLIDAQQASKETMDAYVEMRRGYNTEQYQKMVQWIEALIVQNQTQMIMCAPNKLPDLQVRVKQFMALRSAMVDPGGASTGFTFD